MPPQALLGTVPFGHLRPSRTGKLERLSVSGKLPCDPAGSAVAYDREAEAPEGRGTVRWEVVKGRREDALRAGREEKVG